MGEAFRRWCGGAVIGTLLVAATSPWFVRSYLPKEPGRTVHTLPSGYRYRWRSEGYATTHIGPHGMPGKLSLADSGTDLRVALWGDSQAEGVCVSDDEKIFAQIESLAKQHAEVWSVYPLARSGDDLDDWLAQTEWAEEHLSVDVHLILLAELSDLRLAAEWGAPNPQPDPQPAPMNQWLAQMLPDFVIESGRHLLTGPDGTSQRTLRFSWGPVAPPTPAPIKPEVESNDDFAPPVEAILQHTSVPVWFVYAPRVPQIVAGRKRFDDPQASAFRSFSSTVNEFEIPAIDLRTVMCQSARSGAWPHGFHNGRIGSGHLNAAGNRLIAQAVFERLRNRRAGANKAGP